MSRRPLLLALLAGTACGLTSLESGAPPELRSETLSVQVVESSGRLALLFQAVDAAGQRVPVARLDGVRLAVAESGRVSERLLPFAQVQTELSALSLECEPLSDHTIRLRVVMSPTEDRVQVRVEDEVALLSQIHGVTLDYQFLPEEPVDQSFLPHLQPGSEQVVGDVAFRTPLGYLRSGTTALALVPDVDLLNRERRLPQAMEMDMEPSPRLRHGLVSYRTLGVDNDDPDFLTRQGAAPVVVQGESLHFAHELHLLADASRRSLGEISAALWLQRTAGSFADSLTPLDPLSREVFEDEIADGWASVEVGGALAGTIRSAAADELGLTGSVAWFTTMQQNLRTAYGLDLYAARTNQPELHEKVVQMVDLLLGAPRRGGLLPGLVSLDESTEQTPWRPAAAQRGALTDHYRALDTAWTAYWLLRLVDRVPERRAAILALCAETVRFLVINQLANGAIPAYYDPSFLSPLSEPLYENGLESAGIGLFLAEYGAVTGDAATLRAGRRALDLLIADGPGQKAGDAETVVAAGALHREGDPRSRQWPLGSLSLIYAAHAALALSESGYPQALQLAEELLDRLGLFQQQWSPTWVDADPPGGLGTSNLELGLGTGRESMAAHVWFRGYLATGRADFLRRGALALRAGLAMPTADLNWGGAAACTTAEIARASLGQGVVDVAGSFAQGLDALWFEDLVVSGANVSLRLLSREDFSAGARIVFRNLGEQTSLSIVANDEPLGTFSAEELAAGVTVPVRRVARLYFQPPGAIHHLAPWYPRARFEGDLVLEGRSVVEIHTGGGLLTELEMVPGETAGTLVASDPFMPEGLPLGARIQARLVVVQGGRPDAEPAPGFREIVLEEMHNLDAGDDDEANLFAAGTSQTARFADGRENCRSVPPGGGSFTYWIPVAPEAERLSLSVYLSGGVRLSCEENPLHEDAPGSSAPIRELELQIADRRLWREEGEEGKEGIYLTFAAAGPEELQVARIRYLAEGQVDLPTDVGQRASVPARAGSLRVLVVPVDLPDRPFDAGDEALRQAFFGPEYRVTPVPESRRTAGSAAELVAAISGGLTSLEGEVVAPLPLDLVAADLQRQADGGRAAIARALDDALRDTIHTGYDVVAVVHGQGTEPLAMDAGALPATDTAPAIVFLADRDPDGSFLPVGRLLGAILEARFGFERMDGPTAGNFGELALTAAGSSHIPSGPVGVNLLRSGWVDRVVVTEREQPLVRLPILQEDRAFYLLRGLGASADDELLPGRGNLILEDRHGGAGEPGLPAGGGALIYWEFPDHRPLLISSEGERSRPRFLRLSPRRSILETPFLPGSADPLSGDLFSEPVSLGADTRPSLVAPQGELIWSVDNLRPTSDGRRSATLRYHPLDLLEVRDVGWRTGVGDRPATPLVLNAPLRGLGQAALDRDGLELTTRPEPTGSVAAIFPLFDGVDRREVEAVDLLLQRLEPDRERSERLRAVRSLQNLGVAESVSALLQYSRDEDPQVAAAVRRAADEISATAAGYPKLPSMRPHRLLGRLAWTRGGPGELRIGVGDREYFRTRLQATERRSHFEVDLPAFASGDIGPLWLQLVHLDGEPTSVRIPQLVVVPRDRAWFETQPAASEAVRWMDGGYRSEVMRMRVPQSGEVGDSTPVMLPEGQAMLRILAGLEFGNPEERTIGVSLSLRSRDGTWATSLADPITLRRGSGSQPALIGLISIPQDRPSGVLFLDLTVTGEPGSTLHVQALEIVRL